MIRSLVFSMIACWASLNAAGADKAVFGSIDVPKDERIASSVEIRTVVTVARADCSKAPVAMFQQLPVYPSSLTRAGVVGEATVSFTISEEGVVSDAKVEKASVAELGQASVGAVLNWRFFPAEKEKKPVSIRATAKFVFSMFDENGG
jgi:TonB family protein